MVWQAQEYVYKQAKVGANRLEIVRSFAGFLLMDGPTEHIMHMDGKTDKRMDEHSDERTMPRRCEDVSKRTDPCRDE